MQKYRTFKYVDFVSMKRVEGNDSDRAFLKIRIPVGV